MPLIRRTGRPRRIRFVAWLASVAVILVGLHGAAWFVITGRIEAAITEFVTEAGQYGVVIATGPLRRAGWPWSAQVEAADVSATQARSTASWRAPRVIVAVLPGDPTALHVTPVGLQALELPAGRPVAVEGGRVMLRIPFVAHSTVGVSISDTVVQPADGTGWRIVRLDAQVAAEAAVVTASIEPLRALPPPFDGTANIHARITTTPALPPLANPAGSIATWQAEQGRIDVPEFSLMFGPLQVSGSGTGGLDATLQPRFSARLQLRGVGKALAAAVQAGILQQGQATAANAVYSVLALASIGGPVTVPARLEQGVVSVAGFPLLRTPRVAWPSP